MALKRSSNFSCPFMSSVTWLSLENVTPTFCKWATIKESLVWAFAVEGTDRIRPIRAVMRNVVMYSIYSLFRPNAVWLRPIGPCYWLSIDVA